MRFMSTVAVPWFPRESYPDVLATMADAADFPATYDEWVVGFQAARSAALENNEDVFPVTLDPAAFAQWCEARSLTPDAEARARWANESALGRGGR